MVSRPPEHEATQVGDSLTRSLRVVAGPEQSCPRDRQQHSKAKGGILVQKVKEPLSNLHTNSKLVLFSI